MTPTKRFWMLAAIGVFALPIGVIGVCAGLTQDIERARRRQCAGLLDLVRDACHSYRAVKARYPWEVVQRSESRAIDAGVVYSELCQARPAYLRADNRSHMARALLDPWGRPIRFKVHPIGGTPVIWSVGPDGVSQADGGVTSDPQKYPEERFFFGAENLGDDIVVGDQAMSGEARDPGLAQPPSTAAADMKKAAGADDEARERPESRPE